MSSHDPILLEGRIRQLEGRVKALEGVRNPPAAASTPGMNTPPSPLMLTYIAQEESDGCMVAAIAMVTGRTYREIRELSAAAYDKGIHWVIAQDVLAHLGYAVMTRYHYRPRRKDYRTEWPCEPFAPAHIAVLEATQGAHAVAMDEAGFVYDPFNRERTSLRHPDYRKIHHIDGIFRVR